jgi:heme A synthase
MVTEALVGAGLVLLELVGGNDSLARAGYLAVHLTNTFCLLAALALVAIWAERPDPGRPTAPDPGLSRGITVLLVLLLFVGVTGAVTALGDTLFPSGSLREGLASDLSGSAPFLLRLRVIHPGLAVIGALVASLVSVRVIRRAGAGSASTAGRWVIGLAVTQVAVGVLNLVLLAPIAIQLVHLLIADLLWLAAVVLAAAVREPGLAG